MDEKELIRLSQEGNGEAFGALVERYKAKVFNLAYSWTQDRAAADDLAQEVFIKAYFSLPGFKSKSEFGTWLYRIALNHIKDYFRKKKIRQKDISLEEAGENALSVENGRRGEEEQSRERRKALVQAALQRLPEKYRIILTLRDLQGLSYEEISRILRLSPGTVDSRLFRARKKLRDKLAAYLSREGGEYGL
jgi:RNA polymerase sigma-70 factor (ECF subfamily)